MPSRYRACLAKARDARQRAAGDGLRARLELRNSADEVCATAEASLPDQVAELPALDTWPDVAQVESPPTASQAALSPGTQFGLNRHGFHADRAGEYLDDIRETLPLFRTDPVAHPGWLLRMANSILVANVTMGPWTPSLPGR